MNKVQKFDPKSESIHFWFINYSVHSSVYEWSKKQHSLALPFFFHSSLSNFIYLSGPENCCNKIISIVEKLVNPNKLDIYLDLNDMFLVFDQLKFSKNEMKFWIELYEQIDILKSYFKKYTRNFFTYQFSKRLLFLYPDIKFKDE